MQDDSRIDHRLLDQRHDLQELGAPASSSAEPHHALDARAVVPAAVEDHDFARRRQVLHVALDVHLALLALGRRRQRNDAEHARTDPFGDRLDRAALAGGVAAFEHDADLEPLVDDPLLQLDQLDVQPLELFLVILALELLGLLVVVVGSTFLRFMIFPTWKTSQ